ncbi:uncharacterized protein [Haliotis cracherodii]|uniref:uncharacterized protein n=1 Tax=Haliotis cracherodii TaxID=6455 RepID=UPI0039E7684F
MDTVSVEITFATYLIASFLIAFAPTSNRVEALNIPRYFKNCSDCRGSLGKDIQQLKRLQLIRMRLETALRIGRHGSPMQSDGIPRKHSVPQQAEKEEIITFSQAIGRKEDSSILEFVLDTSRKRKELEVLSANLWVLVKKRGKTKKGKRIVLKVFQLKDKGLVLLTYLRTKVKKTRWQKLSLPISLIQTLVEPPLSTLKLRIDCRRCGREVKLVLPRNRNWGKRRKARRPSPRGLRTNTPAKRRPFLHIFTRVKFHS